MNGLTYLLTIVAVFSALDTPAWMGVSMFNFEKDDPLTTWTVSSGQDQLQREPHYATVGRQSLRFTTPAWGNGLPEWPAFEVTPPVGDWRPFDRFVIDITNPTEDRLTLSLFITDSGTPFREGFKYQLDLPAKDYRRHVIPISDLKKKVDISNISLLHFSTQRPVGELSLYLDSLCLLEKGENPLGPMPEFLRDLADLFLEEAPAFATMAEAYSRRLEEDNAPGDLRQEARSDLEAEASRLQEYLDEISSSPLTLDRLEFIQTELERYPARFDRVLSVLKFRADLRKVGRPDRGLLVGAATSMEKILPRDMPFELKAPRQLSLSLARREKESLQIGVLARDGDMREVEISVTELEKEGGTVFPPERVQCEVVGFVQTEHRPPYDVPYVGWWPDPILNFLGPVDVAKGDLQTFWVRVKCPEDQPAGVYRGQLRVAAVNLEPIFFDLSIRIYDFALPPHAPLPGALSFFEEPSQMGGKATWPERKTEYADFLADYYIDYDHLYRGGPPDFDILKRLSDRGQLVAFNLGNVLNGGVPAEEAEDVARKAVERLRPAYDQAKEMGFLNHAYIYGFDERGSDQFDQLETTARILREAFPEVLLLTTSYDHSYGLDSPVKTLDGWCPLTPRYDPERAARARQSGRSVWWYICCSPHHPWANWFIEYPAIETRLLTGAQTVRYRPDGFLYYALDMWKENQPIETGPFTTWNPVSWTTYHGDGSLLCAGPGGRPVPTIRLENYRDGLEDFAYAIILEAIVLESENRRESLTEAETAWLEEARSAAEVPRELVRSLREFSRDPESLYLWRNRMGELIERSGRGNINPWGDDFGARGFSSREPDRLEGR